MILESVENGPLIWPTVEENEVIITKKYAERAFWLRMSDPTNKPSDALPVKIEAPKELPKISLVNESLKKLKFHLTKFDNVILINVNNGIKVSFANMDAAVQQSISDKQCLEIAKKEVLLKMIDSCNKSLKCSTSKCESKPTGNKRNDMISQTPSRNMKNKLEGQHRKVNKQNYVVKPIHDDKVKHSLSHANSQPVYATYKKSLFDGVHDIRFLDFE
ncbi:hypothetical protein Tco_0569230 [Tanacetum coccineum]